MNNVDILISVAFYFVICIVTWIGIIVNEDTESRRDVIVATLLSFFWPLVVVVLPFYLLVVGSACLTSNFLKKLKRAWK